VFKHVVPYDHDMLRFFHTLGNVRADIGIAPLAETDFNACKSELHWLDMTAASVPVVAQRFMGDGPYGVIRDGVDGLLVRGAREWHDAVSRLAKEPALRADLVGAARERIAIDYDPARRAAEWVSVFDAALHRSPVLERSH
jgi:glycosyltransferase involved in cell wall biosynthesis